jgi:transcriptional regulator with XRE-family HTH domain
MIRRMGLTEELTQNRISAYELGEREPQLYVLLAYARAIGSGAYLEHLIDDELDLPDKLPSNPKSDGVKHKKGMKKG